MKYCTIVFHKFSNEWLSKSRIERKKFEQNYVIPILTEFSQELEFSSFDAECFEAEWTDFMIIRTQNLAAYYLFMEKLQNSPLITEGLARIDRIVIGIEDGFRVFEQEQNI